MSGGDSTAVSSSGEPGWSLGKIALVALWIGVKLTIAILLSQTDNTQFIYAGF